MLYKVGDKVRVKEWEWLKKQYNYINGNLEQYISNKESDCVVLESMKDFCGRVVTITKVLDDYYMIKEADETWRWQDWMFSGYGFEFGEKIEVSNDGIIWDSRIYVGYIDGAISPYCCVCDGEEKSFLKGLEYATYEWRYARPIQRKHTIIIDGKEIQISEESYKQLKESLLKEELYEQFK